MITLLGLKRCSTCKAIEKLLDEKHLAYTYREIDVEQPTKKELKAWHAQSGLPLKRFFNTSGMIYREQGLAKKLPTMSEEDQFDLLASNGMIVKRPMLFVDDAIYVGPQVKKYLTEEA